MTTAVDQSVYVLGVSLMALAMLASCAPSRLQTQQANPDYVGKPFKSVMVVAVSPDELVRRPFEDRMVAMLGKHGVKAIAGYSEMPSRGKVEEADLRQALTRSPPPARYARVPSLKALDFTEFDYLFTRTNSLIIRPSLPPAAGR